MQRRPRIGSRPWSWPLALCAALAWSAPAEADPPSEPEIPVQDIVISATRTPEASATAPASATILTAADQDKTPYRQGHQVDDLLRFVPGVQPSLLSSRFNHPTAQAVSLRGLGARRALVLLDGLPLNDGFGGWINWGLIPDAIDRIEIVPGGGSNLYGPWAMGGVIHVITTRPRAEPGWEVEGRAGTRDTYTTSVSGRYRTDRLGASLGYRWFHTNGFMTVPPEQRGPIDQPGDSRHQLFTGGLAWGLSSRSELTLSGSLFREDRSFGTPLSLATRTIGTVSLGLSGAAGGGQAWEISAFGSWQTFRNKTGQAAPAGLRLTEFRDRIQTIPSNDFGASFQWTSDLAPGHRLVLGTDARGIIGQSEEELFTMTGAAGRSLAEGKQVGWGAYGEWIARVTDRLTLVPSLRVDWWRNFDGRLEAQDGTVTIPPSNTETAVNPKLAARYRLAEDLSVAAALYRAFRVPTLNELYRGFSFGGFSFLPNAALAPERLWGGELGLSVDRLFGGRGRLRLTGHYDEVEDQIVFVSDGPLSATRRNVGGTRTIGAEVEGTLALGELVSLTLGYAYADSTIREFPADPTREGNRLPNVSAHQVIVALTLGTPGTVQLTVLGRYLSRQFADDLNQQPIADFVVLDASLRKDLGRRLRLYLDAENLTDRDYIVTQTGAIKTLGPPLLVTGGVRVAY